MVHAKINDIVTIKYQMAYWLERILIKQDKFQLTGSGMLLMSSSLTFSW
ncbi:MAG: hypothetical protein WB988_21820 [Candidatus Nitrosopolaris sp.]